MSRSVRSYVSRAAAQPTAHQYEHRNDGRSIGVMVLLDLSESLNEKAAGSEQPFCN